MEFEKINWNAGDIFCNTTEIPYNSGKTHWLSQRNQSECPGYSLQYHGNPVECLGNSLDSQENKLEWHGDFWNATEMPGIAGKFPGTREIYSNIGKIHQNERKTH